jgi:Fe-S-cluster containining protein
LQKIILNKSTPLNEVLKLSHPCICGECSNGCKFGSGTLADEDISRIAGHLGIKEEVLKKEFLEEIEKFNTKKFRPRILRKGRPYGKCVFYDENARCMINDVKPLECKISMGCKPYGEQLSIWFMLNNFVNENDPESVRQFATYLKSGGKTLEGAELENLVPDKKKLKEILNYGEL